MAENSDKRTPGLDDPDSIDEMRRRHLSIGLRMQAIAVRALEELEEKVKAGKPLNLREDEAEALLDAGVKLERAALREKEPDADDAPVPRKPN